MNSGKTSSFAALLLEHALSLEPALATRPAAAVPPGGQTFFMQSASRGFFDADALPAELINGRYTLILRSEERFEISVQLLLV